MGNQVNPVPDGYRTVTASLVVQDGNRDIAFYEAAFGVEVLFRMDSPDGRLMHAEIQVGDSKVMLGGEMPDFGCKSPAAAGARTGGLYLYVPDVDAAFKRAVDAGAEVVMPLTDMFWGDRMGTVADPAGHHWSLATHKEDLTYEQIDKRAKEWAASHGGDCG